MNPSISKSVLQCGAILLAAVAVGLAYNLLNPGGLRWSDPAKGEVESAKPSTVVVSPGLYRVETLSARIIPLPEPVATTQANASRTTQTTASRTSWELAQALVASGEAVLIDSRSHAIYEAGHIPGAINLPLTTVKVEIAKFAAAYPPPETQLVVYCASETCGSSAKLASLLTGQYGYQHVQYVPGGYLEWVRTRNPHGH